jgi:hypothetical protein
VKDFVARHEDFAGLAKKHGKLLQIDISVVSQTTFQNQQKRRMRQFESGKKIYKINPKRFEIRL